MLHELTSYYTALHDMMRSLLCVAILCFALSYCTMLHYASIVQCVILYYVMLDVATLYHTILHHAILCYTTPRDDMFDYTTLYYAILPMLYDTLPYCATLLHYII